MPDEEELSCQDEEQADDCGTACTARLEEGGRAGGREGGRLVGCREYR